MPQSSYLCKEPANKANMITSRRPIQSHVQRLRQHNEKCHVFHNPQYTVYKGFSNKAYVIQRFGLNVVEKREFAEDGSEL